MAECIRYVCNHCSKDLQSRSDGNPYFINASGSKEYAYHPNHEGLIKKRMGRPEVSPGLSH
jgi:hypothetical protein